MGLDASYFISFINNLFFFFCLWFAAIKEFDMIGLFGTQSGSLSLKPPSTATAFKSKATNLPLDNQINDKLKEVNNNLIKKRPNFLKFFNFETNLTTTSSDNSSSSCKKR